MGYKGRDYFVMFLACDETISFLLSNKGRKDVLLYTFLNGMLEGYNYIGNKLGGTFLCYGDSFSYAVGHCSYKWVKVREISI